MTHKMKIVLIEDDDTDAFIAQHMLSTTCTEDCLITRFPNGKEAVDHLKNEDFSSPFVIILDINMPIMDGLEFMQEIRLNTFFQNIKITVLTSSSEVKDIVFFQNFGVNKYYTKPLTKQSSLDILDYARTA
jgi:CheY-like chemotaxis protein